MTALAVATPRIFGTGDPKYTELPVLANAVIYEGSIVAVVTASGYAKASTGDGTTPDKFAGIAVEDVDATGLASGAVTVKVRQEGLLKDETIAGATVDDYGKVVYNATDDNTFTMTSTGAIPVGWLDRFVSTGVGDIRFMARGVGPLVA